MSLAYRSVVRTALRLGVALLAVAALDARAGPIPINTFLEFGFTDPGIAATGCDPADPAGPFCIPSSGTPTSFLDAPPWTFSLAGPAFLRVTDVLESGDRFQVYDNGASLGLTSLPDGVSDCGDDPAVCLTVAGMSKADFPLAAGAHSLTLIATLSPGGGGSGYLAVVPEPATLLTLLVGLAAAAGFARRKLSA